SQHIRALASHLGIELIPPKAQPCVNVLRLEIPLVLALITSDVLLGAELGHTHLALHLLADAKLRVRSTAGLLIAQRTVDCSTKPVREARASKIPRSLSRRSQAFSAGLSEGGLELALHILEEGTIRSAKLIH